MKTIGKFLANKITTLLIAVIALVIGFLAIKYFMSNSLEEITKGTTKTDYSFVIKKFSKKSQLVVADADIETTASQSFSNNALADWPDWTQVIAKVFVSRDLEVEIPMKTAFKLELKDLNEKDINIEDNVLTFDKPLTVVVDSQQTSDVKIKKTSNGLIDRAADAFTSGKKAQEFLSQKTQEQVYKTSKNISDRKKNQEKVAKYAEEALENLLNLKAKDGEELDVQLEVSDLDFKIEDKSTK